MTEDNKPKCDDGSPLYPDIRDKFYSKKVDLDKIVEYSFSYYNQNNEKIEVSGLVDKKELIAEFLTDCRNTCDICDNAPFDSHTCTVFKQGCLIYPLRKKWEAKK